MTRYKLRNFKKGKAFIEKERVGNSIVIGNMICINTKGEKLFELPHPDMMAYDFKDEDVTIVSYEYKHALLNNKGEFLTDFIYDRIYGGSEEGFFEVQKGGKHGHIDLKGREIIPCTYDEGGYFSEGLAPECLNKKWGAIDFNNNIVIPFEYNDLGHCRNNLIPAKKKISKGICKWGLIDKFNNVVADFKFDEIDNYATRNCICYQALIGDYWGFIDRCGNTVEDFKYDDILAATDKDNNFGELCKVVKDDKWALYSTTEAKFLTDFEFDFACFGFGVNDSEVLVGYDDYSQGFLAVKKDGKYGFIDAFGEIIVEPVYDKVEDFRENIAIVKLNNLYGAINMTGEIVIPIEYKRLNDCCDGLILAKNENNEQGFIDKKNNTVIPFGKFYDCQNFSCGYAVVYAESYGEIYINKQGEILEIEE